MKNRKEWMKRGRFERSESEEEKGWNDWRGRQKDGKIKGSGVEGAVWLR
jgi:hypothetical protein